VGGRRKSGIGWKAGLGEQEGSRRRTGGGREESRRGEWEESRRRAGTKKRERVDCSLGETASVDVSPGAAEPRKVNIDV